MLANMSDKVDNIAMALFKSQSAISNVVKDRSGYNFKYAELSQVLDIIKSAITPNDLSFIQLVGPVTDNKVSIESLLIHSSGQFISCLSETFIEEDEKKNKMRSKVQNVGASVTYLRRKAAIAFFSIAEEDEIDSRQEQEPVKNFKPAAPRAVQSQNAPVVAPIQNNVQSINTPVEMDSLLLLRRLINQSSVPAITGNTILEKSKVENLEALTDAQAKVWIAKLQEASKRHAS